MNEQLAGLDKETLILIIERRRDNIYKIAFAYMKNRFDADGTRIAAGVKMEGGQNSKTGAFNRHYMLQNLVDAKEVVAIEYSGNLINLK